ncbi:RNA polymerase Rpb3/Rpb11 [Neobacillus bataviensis]|uniref:RNA polymerase Rpb3/Rpb11 n=1 Tax=Neobacillus bataviensis TaxID=220685 RepID=A0A561D5J6_9BACI|nr:RNA polymerase Rpb3/Rpb11 [Neobacillus bataviensis]
MNILSDDEKELIIDVHRTGTITAADISHDSDVEILIPDLHLATLKENVHFRMRLKQNVDVVMFLQSKTNVMAFK